MGSGGEEMVDTFVVVVAAAAVIVIQGSHYGAHVGLTFTTFPSHPPKSRDCKFALP